MSMRNTFSMPGRVIDVFKVREAPISSFMLEKVLHLDVILTPTAQGIQLILNSIVASRARTRMYEFIGTHFLPLIGCTRLHLLFSDPQIEMKR